MTGEEGIARLVNGLGPHEGRVEVYHNGQWGTVCDDFWSNNDAAVLCRQLGYERALAVHREAFFGEGTGPIWYDNLFCTGSEATLNECPHNGIGVHNCGHNEDAGVTCDGKSLGFGSRVKKAYHMVPYFEKHNCVFHWMSFQLQKLCFVKI